jgi:hypothetical protein
MKSIARWVLLAGSLACAALAWREWTYDVPPLWSLAAPRAETVVTRAELVEESRANGHHAQVPHVFVAWPPEDGTEEELAGLRSSHDVWHMHTPAEYVREHPAGSPISVRVVEGHPMADRTDLRDLGYALAASLLALILGAGGLALSGRGSPREEVAG